MPLPDLAAAGVARRAAAPDSVCRLGRCACFATKASKSDRSASAPGNLQALQHVCVCGT